MRPDLAGNFDALRIWWRKRVSNRHSGIGIAAHGDGDSTTAYLHRDGLPLVANGMAQTVATVAHDVYGHRSSRSLYQICMRKFAFTGKGSRTLMRAVVDSHECDDCANERVLPKPEHIQSVRVYGKAEVFQMDFTEIASNKIEKIKSLRGDHGYRYVHITIDKHTKKAWGAATRTMLEGS